MVSEKQNILKEILGNGYKSGEEYLFFCPRCNHHKKKLSVNLNKNAFKCWICGYRSKTILSLVKSFGSQSHLNKWIAITGEVDLSENQSIKSKLMRNKKQEVRYEQHLILPKEFVSLIGNHSLASSQARKYLQNRGITEEDINHWKMGFAVEGEYCNRIIIPSCSDKGYINFFVSRTYSDEYPKYKNPATNRDIVFNELMIDWDKPVTIVEGVFDAIKAGFNAIPLLGSVLDENHSIFQNLVQHKLPVYISLDTDAKKKEYGIIKKMLFYGLEVCKIDIEGYNDIGEMSKVEFEKRKREAVKMSQEKLMLFRMER